MKKRNSETWQKLSQEQLNFRNYFERLQKEIVVKNVWGDIILKGSVSDKTKTPLIIGLQKVASKGQIAGEGPLIAPDLAQMTLIYVLVYWLIQNCYCDM